MQVLLWSVLVALLFVDLQNCEADQPADKTSPAGTHASQSTEHVAEEVPIWKSGVGRRRITPRRPMWMSGYAGRDRPAEGTLTDLWAKVLVIEDPVGSRCLLITLDLIGIDRELSHSICQQLVSTYSFTRDQIAICCSHTHTGPALRSNLAPMHYWVVSPEQRTLIDDYVEFLQASIVEAVDDAVESLQPGEIAWGSGQATFAANRRENSEANARALRTGVQLAGPIDHSVPVFAIRRPDGSLKCIVFGYACHATTLSSYVWSGDYPGFAQMELERNHPGCTAMFWAGCGADQNPLPRRSIELCKHYGRRLAIAVESVLLTTEMHELQGRLATSYDEVDLAISEIPPRSEIALDTKSTNPFIAARAEMLLARLDSGKAIEATYPYPIGVWQLGDDLHWVLLGGEVVVDYAIRLKIELPKNNWVAAYTNDVMAYIPSRRVLMEGGYEADSSMVYYGMPNPWAGTVESDIMKKVKAMVRGLPAQSAQE